VLETLQNHHGLANALIDSTVDSSLRAYQYNIDYGTNVTAGAYAIPAGMALTANT
jgi:hypothetical protein